MCVSEGRGGRGGGGSGVVYHANRETIIDSFADG